MGYVKAIIYGTCLELYSYEKDIRATGGKKRTVQKPLDLSIVANGGSIDPIQELRKRQGHKNRAISSFRRLVIANNGFTTPPALITFTYAENQTSLDVGYKDFHACIRAMRHTFGSSFRYIAVPEFQKRGAIHFHALFWGLPENICSTERDTRMVATLWGRGFVDCYATDGSVKLAGYLAKYMSKSYLDVRLSNKKAYRCSRNVFRPVIEKNLGGIWYLSHCYGIGVDNPPCKDVEFQTQYLGKGRYRLYNLISTYQKP